MGEGNDARAVLENKLYPLSRGYVGVINRNQSDIDKKKSIADAIESEKKFFNTHPAYKFLSDRLGIHCLQRILIEQFTNHISYTLPALRNELTAESLDIVKYLLEKYYQLDDTASEINLFEMHRLVLDSFHSEIGFYESDEVSEIPNGGSKINKLMHTSLPLIFSHETLEDLRKQVIGTIQNVRGARKGQFAPDKAFEIVLKAQISKYEEPSMRCVSLVIKELTNTLFYCTEHQQTFINENDKKSTAVNENTKKPQQENKKIYNPFLNKKKRKREGRNLAQRNALMEMLPQDEQEIVVTKYKGAEAAGGSGREFSLREQN
ncbi:hypothetical protein HCN44_000280 [Aphidius gifuensis]|uniref:Dynamin stalk domain-containing protein n=1 Tax=Aphidius gifuensis TaxID=684658 RepID=A0A834XRL7_APHGI|nr:hypothetical protein HCN44_000280 [Aphidius gifuensis]